MEHYLILSTILFFLALWVFWANSEFAYWVLGLLFRNLIFLVLGTLINYLYYVEYLKSIPLFCLRQIVFMVFLLFKDHFKSELSVFAEEDKYINRTVNAEYPIIKYRFLFALSSALVLYFGVNDESDIDIALLLSGILLAGFVFLCLLRVHVILNSPALIDFYNVPKSVKYHGVRSISTMKSIMHSGKMVAGVGLIAFCGDFVGTKVVYGDIGARGWTENFLSSHCTKFGLKARTNVGLRLGNNFMDYNPGWPVSEILDKDGNVCLAKLREAYKATKTPYPPNMFDSKHKVKVKWPWQDDSDE